jgi:nitrite reductase/ring-hydroxylating ferredoxin subunit
LQALCHIDSIAEGQSLGIEHQGQHYFAVRKHGQIFLYRNQCPHLGCNLDWQEHQFLDSSASLIQCCHHGALFLIDSGQCISGPCQGEQLQTIPFTLEQGWLYLRAQP